MSEERRDQLERKGEGGQKEAEQKEVGQKEAEIDSISEIEPLLDERIVRAIHKMGFEKLTPIQQQAIPALLQGVDIIGQAQTGTGKTAAFGIPAIQKCDPELKKLQTIILCPTRELAIQAAAELRKLSFYMHGIKVLPIYGGQDISKQITGLRGVQIIVGTPGRVMDHMRRKTIRLDHVNMVVLDEADEMLNMGFCEDMETILGQIPGEHQTALFSATMPQPILEITGQFQKDARMIRVAAKELTIPLVSQKFYRIKPQDKDAACVRLLDYYQPKLCLVFCNTKKKVDELTAVLKEAGYQAEGLHGDLVQHQRDVVMGRFRNGSTNILIATDVAARGIDVDNVEAVINYDIPQDIEYYVHRIGRTGRAGKKGRSFTFVSGREIFQLREIEKICRTTVEEKKLPNASKVLKSKADKYLEQAWELHEHEDMELMKEFLQRKMEEEDCDALELAAAMLKYQVGDKGEEIETDEYRTGRERGRGGRGGWDGREERADRRTGRHDSWGRRDERNSYGDRGGEAGRGRRDGRNDRGEEAGRGRRGGRSDRGGEAGRGRRNGRNGRNGNDDYNNRGSREERGRHEDRRGQREDYGGHSDVDNRESRSKRREKFTDWRSRI